MELERYGHVIAGEAALPRDEEFFPSFDPVTGSPWAEIARGSGKDIDRAVQAAHEAFLTWRAVGPSRRAELLWNLGDLLAERSEEIARVEARDVGKVIREMRGQISGLKRWYQYYGSLANIIEGRAIQHDSQTIVNYTKREPYGVIGVIPAFNSPILLSSWAVGPALAAGNTVVIKPPEVASAAVTLFAQLFTEVGFPPGVVNVVTGYGQEVGEALVDHDLVRKVFFTGGCETGRSVATNAARKLKPTVLELGGKAANIVFGDVDDLDSVARGVVAGIFAASGQTCVAGSRLVVHESVADKLTQLVARRAASIVIGDPLDEATEMGPLAQAKIRDGVEEHIASATAQGARVVVGGGRPASRPSGWFFEPTVVDNVTNSMDIARTELFGPVLAVLRFAEDDEAISLANDTPFGLAAGLWTRDVGRAHRVADALDASTVWVNTYRSVSYRSPFGGRRASGYGRENGIDGLLEMTQTKSIWIESSGEPIGDPFVLR